MTVLTFTLILAVALGFAIASRLGVKQANMEDYLVAGRSFGGLLIFVLAVGEVYSVATLAGFPGGIYANGASYGIWFMGYVLLAYPVGYVLLPLIWRAGKRYSASTYPDIFRQHFSSRTLELVVAGTSILFLIPWGQLQLTGLQVVFESMDLGISPNLAAVLGAGAAFGFIVLSGVRAPAFVSVIKDIVLIVAVIVVGVVVLVAAKGVPEVFSAARDNLPSVTMTGSSFRFSMTTIVFQAMAFYMLPFFALAIFSGKSARAVKRTQTFMPMYMVMYPFLVFVSVYAIREVPGLKGADSNQAFMLVTKELTPPWILGLVAGAAALAAIVVLTVASLVIGGLISRNVVPGLSQNRQRRTTQTVVLVYLAISLLMTIGAPSLMTTIVNTAYFGIGQFFPCMMIVLFGGRVRPLAIAAGIIIADIVAVTLFLTKVDVAGINIGLIALALNCLILGVSRLVWPATNPPESMVAWIKRNRPTQTSFVTLPATGGVSKAAPAEAN